MSRSYSIWNDVQACIYKGSKSWGAKNTCDVNVKCWFKFHVLQSLCKPHNNKKRN